MADATTIAEPGIDVFNGIFEAHRREGFDAGYRRGAREVLSLLAISSEEVLMQHRGNTRELREALYAVLDRVERRVDLRFDADEFEGGLGI
jgi:hypothetical protein